MNKTKASKILLLSVAILAVLASPFLWQKFFETNKKEIAINNSEIKDDILGDPVPAEDNSDNKIQRSSDFVMEEKNSVDDKNILSDGSKESSLNIINKLASAGFQKYSGRKIDTIIIHSSYDAIGDNPYDVDGLIKEYKSYGVAPHYLINREGKIYRLVEEKNIAYHAGAGQLPDGRTNINEISIGIELMNTKDDKFTPGQYEALKKLIENLKLRYSIKYVLGHNQIAPGRKDDPWNFDWGKIK